MRAFGATERTPDGCTGILDHWEFYTKNRRRLLCDTSSLGSFFCATVGASLPADAQESLEISEAFQEVRKFKFQYVVPEAGLEPARF